MNHNNDKRKFDKVITLDYFIDKVNYYKSQSFQNLRREYFYRAQYNTIHNKDFKRKRYYVHIRTYILVWQIVKDLIILRNQRRPKPMSKSTANGNESSYNQQISHDEDILTQAENS